MGDFAFEEDEEQNLQARSIPLIPRRPLIWVGHWWPVGTRIGTTALAMGRMPTLETILVDWLAPVVIR